MPLGMLCTLLTPVHRFPRPNFNGESESDPKSLRGKFSKTYATNVILVVNSKVLGSNTLQPYLHMRQNKCWDKNGSGPKWTHLTSHVICPAFLPGTFYEGDTQC